MNELLSLDSHLPFFDEAEKEVFDIDLFLSFDPVSTLTMPTNTMVDAVFGSPFSSPSNKSQKSSLSEINSTSSVSTRNGAALSFQEDRLDLGLSSLSATKSRRGSKKTDPVRQKLKKYDVNDNSSYIRDLERRVNELVNENSQLKETVHALTSDKVRLENEVLRMQTVMSDTISKNGELSEDMLDVQLLNSKNLLGIRPNSQGSTTAILLIILLSFSLLFNNAVTTESYDMQSSPTNHTRTVSNTPKNSPKLDTDKDLLLKVTKKVEKLQQLPNGTQNKSTKRVLRHDKNSVVSTRSVKRRKEEPKSSTSTPSHISPQNSYTPTPAPANNIQSRVIPDISKWRPNTTYLMCNNVSQILPPSNVVSNNPQNVMVSLLIPPDTFGTPKENSLLEVTCQVIEVSSVPSKIV
jgi:regulator of replication initiation timing